jgi:hypothetical protein
MRSSRTPPHSYTPGTDDPSGITAFIATEMLGSALEVGWKT